MLESQITSQGCHQYPCHKEIVSLLTLLNIHSIQSHTHLASNCTGYLCRQNTKTIADLASWWVCAGLWTSPWITLVYQVGSSNIVIGSCVYEAKYGFFSRETRWSPWQTPLSIPTVSSLRWAVSVRPKEILQHLLQGVPSLCLCNCSKPSGRDFSCLSGEVVTESCI